MIATDLEHLAEQMAMSPAMRRALDWLQSVRGTDLADGRVEIDGVEAYALVQSYDSKPAGDRPRFEAHRKYVDLQVVVAGRERFGWAPLAQMEPTDEYSPEKDVVHGTVTSDAAVFVPLSAGQVMVLYPSDAHAPGLADGAPSPVKKIVLKVRL
jgi:YhcH/YjgK/YiaL family protein